MAKHKTKITAKRQVFLDALEIIKKYERKDGINFSQLADDLAGLLDNAPHSGWLAEEWAICSALWASEIPLEIPAVDDIHEHCKGGELFLVAYFLGRRHSLREKTRAE